MFIHTDSQVEERARAFHTEGIKPVDALHLASALDKQLRPECGLALTIFYPALMVGDAPTIETVEARVPWLWRMAE